MPKSILGIVAAGAGAAIIGNTLYNEAGDGILLWDPQFGGSQKWVNPATGGWTWQQVMQLIVGILLLLLGLYLLLKK